MKNKINVKYADGIILHFACKRFDTDDLQNN